MASKIWFEQDLSDTPVHMRMVVCRLRPGLFQFLFEHFVHNISSLRQIEAWRILETKTSEMIEIESVCIRSDPSTWHDVGQTHLDFCHPHLLYMGKGVSK